MFIEYTKLQCNVKKKYLKRGSAALRAEKGLQVSHLWQKPETQSK